MQALAAVPDALFIDAAETGRGYVASMDAYLSGGIDYTGLEFRSRITELFLANGVPYQFNDDDQLIPSGSPTVYVASVEPAMDVLDDERLSTAREHLIEAQRRLQEPDPEEAVDEARQAVEAAMIALLTAREGRRATSDDARRP
jgi:hypothetical protein